MFRKTLFWIHLGCGVCVGLIVAMLSLTGIILAYEKQILNWVDASNFEYNGPEREPIDLGLMVERAQSQIPRPLSLVRIPVDPEAPYSVDVVRTPYLVNQFTGELMDAHEASHGFFAAVTRFHRWFNLSDEAQARGQTIVAFSNAVFAFLLVSGLYLWFPRRLKWRAFRKVLVFRSDLKGKARDFNWHHVFGFWSLAPLFVVVMSGVFISYPSVSAWFQGLVVGTERTGAAANEAGPINTAVPNAEPMGLDELRRLGETLGGGWNFMEIPLPISGPTALVSLDYGSGRAPQQETTFVVDRYSGDVLDSYSYAQRPLAQTIVAWIRYAHTGEAFGLPGQTIAGIVSLTSLLMVWTGLALAYRRLIVPLYRRGT